MNLPLETYLVSSTATIRETLGRINASKGLALVVTPDRRLIGTVTDGDVRRAVLSGIRLEAPVQDLFALRDRELYPTPVTAPSGTSSAELLAIMNDRAVRHIPLLNETGEVVDVAAMEGVVKELDLPINAVVMAGGFGARLQPLTEHLPKPMLPVGGRPILETIVRQLQESGVGRVQVTTHYKPEAIEAHFGDGRSFGLDIQYVNEDQPLGTAGALSLIEPTEQPTLLINGDILTQVDFRTMLAFHREHGAELTVAVRQYDVRVPYGVIECDGARVRKVEEKPMVNFLVNAGIYLLEPAAHRSIPKGVRSNMTDLIEQLIAQSRTVAAFPIIEYWLDVGQHGDYAQAQEDIKLWEKKS